METPVLRTAPAPMFLLAKLVRNSKFKVVLTGEGADEFLAGYDIFKEAKIRRFWADQPFSKLRPLLLKKLYADIGGLAATGASNLAAFFGHQLTETGRPEYSHLIRWRNNRRTCRFFSPERRANLMRTDNLGEGVAFPAGFDRWHPLHKAQHLEISVFLSQYLLSSQGDRMGMAHSVEGRFPFLDVRFLEFANRVPTKWKINRLTEKYLLRQMSKSFLPESISNRGKRPYRAPIHKSFINSRTPDYLAEILSPAALKRSGIFDAGAVDLLMQKLQRGQAIGETDDMAFVGIVSTQLVHKQFVESFPRVSPISAEDDVKVVRRMRAAQLA
jgi:asparagine synthase (glutamine-hydrolysing)